MAGRGSGRLISYRTRRRRPRLSPTSGTGRAASASDFGQLFRAENEEVIGGCGNRRLPSAFSMRKPSPRQSNRRSCAPNPLLVHHPSNHVLPPDPIGEEPRAGLQNLPSSPNPRLSRFSIRHWDPPFFQFHSRGRLVRDRELGVGRLGGRYGSYFARRLWARDGTPVPHHGWRRPSEQRG
jgi:hypothetical protein